MLACLLACCYGFRVYLHTELVLRTTSCRRAAGRRKARSPRAHHFWPPPPHDVVMFVSGIALESRTLVRPSLSLCSPLSALLFVSVPLTTTPTHKLKLPRLLTHLVCVVALFFCISCFNFVCVCVCIRGRLSPASPPSPPSLSLSLHSRT